MSKPRGLSLPGALNVALAPEHFRPIRGLPTDSDRADSRGEQHERDTDAEMIALREAVTLLQARVEALEVQQPPARPTTPPPIWSEPASPACVAHDEAQEGGTPTRTRKKKRRTKKRDESPQGLRKPRPASDLGVRTSPSPSPAGLRKPRARPATGT